MNDKTKPNAEDGTRNAEIKRPPQDRMIRRPATTRDVLGHDFHKLAQTEGKPKHDHD